MVNAVASSPLTFIEHYQTYGYATAQGVFHSSQVSEIIAAFNDIERMASQFTEDTFEGFTYFNLHRDCDPFDKNIDSFKQHAGVLRRVTYPYGVSPTLDHYRCYKPLLELAAQLVGPDLKQIVNQANFNPPAIGKGWGWHQDYRFRRQGVSDLKSQFVQTILALDPCNTTNGGLRIIPASDRLGGLKLDENVEEAEAHFDAAQAITPDLSPGDVIFFNPYIIHGSTENKSTNNRRIYINGYSNASASFGKPVFLRGIPLAQDASIMEYERDQNLVRMASKY